MTNDQIRLHFGELNAAEMRLARTIVGWHEAELAKLRAALVKVGDVFSDYFEYQGDGFSADAACKIPDLFKEIQFLIHS